MQESSGRQNYQSFLLRLWSGGGQTGRRWRAALVNPRTGEQLWFSSPDHLFDFLKDQTVVLAEDQEMGDSKE
jgi:hypothetical protein